MINLKLSQGVIIITIDEFFITKSKFSNCGLMISNTPMNPNIIADIRYIPILFFKIIRDNIVIKIGLTKNKALASAMGIFASAK